MTNCRIRDLLPHQIFQRTTLPTQIPEPGQLVEIRQRHFVVTNIRKSGLPIDPLSTGIDRPQHLISLSSVEDDALGEEMQIVWEVEPGARVYEKMSLPEPTGFDVPARLDAFLDAVKWGAISSADVRALQSPFRSGIDIQDYQLDAVVRALQMPRVNLLIADDVGLGKTIEAGLVVQELILRHRVRSVLVVCPSSIQIQWKEEMRDKFGLEFRIVDSDLMRELRRQRGLHVNPWTHFPRLITSIDYLKRERPLRRFREALPAEGEPAFPRRFDLLIIDEAHNVAPSGSGYYAKDSLRTYAIRTLASHFEHKLFLTATPHNGYPESFSALLALLDSRRFAPGVPIDHQQLHAVMVRRMKSELKRKWDGSPRFPERILEAIEVDYTETERRVHRTLREYSNLRMTNLSDTAERFASEFVLKLLKKRLFSSPMAFAVTLSKHETSIATARKRGSVTVKPSPRVLQQQVDLTLEEYSDDEEYEENTAEVIDTMSRLFSPLKPAEKHLLDELRRYAQEASKRADTKARALINWLHDNLKPKGKWNDQRVLIFTEYRATQKWLHTLLAAEGFTEEARLETMYGGMDPKDREKIKAAFQASPKDSKVRILLATDAASEGINLQNHCSMVIHYEIPWNPNRMEQRNGRIDRHGQKAAEVRVHHFVGKGFDRQSMVGKSPGELDGDLEFLMRAALKVETIREDLGKVGPVIASQVEEAMLGKRKILDTARAEKDAEPVRQQLKFERNLRELVEKLNQQLQETKRELDLSPENIQRVVEIGLALAGQPPLKKVELPSNIGGDPTIIAFELPPMAGSWALCHEGLVHPHTGAVRPVVFDHSLVNGRDDIILAHLNHRLVQMCLRLLRAEVWSAGKRKQLHRITARLVSDDALDTVAVIAHGRLVVLGGDNQRLHEEIITAGGVLREGRFSRLNVGELKSALDAATDKEAPKHIKTKIAGLWPSHSAQLLQSLEARMRDRTVGLQKALEERSATEIADTTAILMELERNIRAELDEPSVVQLELWTSTEREQFERNMSSIKARLASIPQEIERETKAIRNRYASPTPRVFPVAVTYIVPEKIALKMEARS